MNIEGISMGEINRVSREMGYRIGAPKKETTEVISQIIWEEFTAIFTLDLENLQDLKLLQECIAPKIEKMGLENAIEAIAKRVVVRKEIEGTSPSVASIKKQVRDFLMAFYFLV